MSTDCAHTSTAMTTMAPAVYSVIPGLPAELLFLICDVVDHSDLYSIALSSRTLNEMATPLLYSVIDLQLFHAIYACTRTLASPASKTALNRDLAGFVESISLRHRGSATTKWTFKDKELGCIKRRLAHAVPRMRRLQSFTCRIAGIYNTGETFTTLASGTLPLVHTIDIDVQLPISDDALAAPQAVTRRGLKMLKLRNDGSRLSAAYSTFLCALLDASQGTLQSLSLPYWAHSALQSAWRSIPSFPALRQLDIPVNILSEPAFQDTTGIRHLVLPRFWDVLEIAPTALPNLEEVTCFSHQLASFLPEDAQHRRPIRAVTLDYVEYGVGRLHLMPGDQGWRPANDPAFSALRFSATRLVRLTFVVVALSATFLEGSVSLLEELEYLHIVQLSRRGERVRDGYGSDEVGALAPLLKRMPRLRTLLISRESAARTSDGGLSDFGRNEDQQRSVLSVYDQHSSSLKRAAFGSDFEWEKREGGWCPRGHEVVAEREVLSDGEDEDEDREQRGS